MVRTVPASLLTKSAPPSARGSMLGRLDATGSMCRVLLPTLFGSLCDHYGLWAAYTLQAGLCVLGMAIIELWNRRARLTVRAKKHE
mmetsp:Transcript_38702/g.77483  ORF Transcript_38702/g.77483 Transcript_38702/m.77483 type:complete len:86 (-) Transcript_38702:164-421(-)